eukprot:MONOS_8190.1-p1 / transcript=MONOS_8190.1 / gene=MONOS_8190 / organism=Monocercomonoides_exilis_PA203 / gene_product=unspecified product / transcript_product=unspecified product / location=Mono_scaffold00302:11712-13751(-) / protein_length=679 / sequence_SO=supercontig / SO=protein_coding / is_pseudo=false
MWAFGMIFFEMCLGYKPLSCNSFEDIFESIFSRFGNPSRADLHYISDKRFNALSLFSSPVVPVSQTLFSRKEPFIPPSESFGILSQIPTYLIPHFCDFIRQTIVYNPTLRISAASCLELPLFKFSFPSPIIPTHALRPSSLPISRSESERVTDASALSSSRRTGAKMNVFSSTQRSTPQTVKTTRTSLSAVDTPLIKNEQIYEGDDIDEAEAFRLLSSKRNRDLKMPRNRDTTSSTPSVTPFTFPQTHSHAFPSESPSASSKAATLSRGSTIASNILSDASSSLVGTVLSTFQPSVQPQITRICRTVRKTKGPSNTSASASATSNKSKSSSDDLNEAYRSFDHTEGSDGMIEEVVEDIEFGKDTQTAGPNYRASDTMRSSTVSPSIGEKGTTSPKKESSKRLVRKDEPVRTEKSPKVPTSARTHRAPPKTPKHTPRSDVYGLKPESARTPVTFSRRKTPPTRRSVRERPARLMPEYPSVEDNTSPLPAHAYPSSAITSMRTEPRAAAPRMVSPPRCSTVPRPRRNSLSPPSHASSPFYANKGSAAASVEYPSAQPPKYKETALSSPTPSTDSSSSSISVPHLNLEPLQRAPSTPSVRTPHHQIPSKSARAKKSLLPATPTTAFMRQISNSTKPRVKQVASSKLGTSESERPSSSAHSSAHKPPMSARSTRTPRSDARYE